MKRRPKTFKANEIPINFSLKVKIPKQAELNANAEITLSETKITEIFVNEI